MKYAVIVFDFNKNMQWEYLLAQLSEAIDRAEYECERPNRTRTAQVVHIDTGEVVYETQS